MDGFNLESLSYWNPAKPTNHVRNQNSTARTNRGSSNTFVVVAKPFHDGAHRLEVILVIVIVGQGRRRKRRKNGERLVEALHSLETFQVVLVVGVRVGNRNNGGAGVIERVLRRNTVFGGGVIVGAWDSNPAGSGERRHILLEAVVIIIVGGGEIVEIVDARSHWIGISSEFHSEFHQGFF